MSSLFQFLSLDHLSMCDVHVLYLVIILSFCKIYKCQLMSRSSTSSSVSFSEFLKVRKPEIYIHTLQGDPFIVLMYLNLTVKL